MSLEEGRATLDLDTNQSSVQAVARAVDQAGGAMHTFKAALLLDVEGVQDKAAADRVQTALQKVGGVRAAMVLLEKRQAVVEFAPQGSVTLQQLADAVQKAGYKVRIARPGKKD